MPKQYIDLDTLKFILYQVHNLEEILQKDRYEDHDLETIGLFLGSVKDFSDQELFPYFKEMDENPAHFKDGKIIVHPQVEVMMKKGGEMGFICSTFDYEQGGLQLPEMVQTASAYIQDAANNHLPGYVGLTMGAAELVAHYASADLQEIYLPKMLSGEWGGTMCLTEPQAGSSLSDIVSSATPTEEGYYSIKGQKIFISAGDHEYVDNFVHLLLARIDGAVSGTKGISLFIVPKKRIDESGELVFNDVITAGDFQKLGQRGYCTTHLMFGEGEDCRGWLVGQAGRGLLSMFHMMNGARIGVGRGAAAITMAAYQASLEYAQERPQGRRLTRMGKKDANQEQTLIIHHPDVRRMLLLQKTVVEGSLSLVLLASKYADLKITATNEADKEKYNLLLELLTPMVKTYPSEMGAQSVSNGLQVLGGYGFCSEYILQQYHRDIRIFPIYEGTTGIQSLDLLGRKTLLAEGKALKLLFTEIMQTINSAKEFEELRPYADKLTAKLPLIQKVLDFLVPFAKKGDFERFVSDANLFMELFSTLTIAWLWLDMGLHATQSLKTEDKTYSEAFYKSKIHAMKFYFKYELAKTSGLAETLTNEEVLTIPTEKTIF